jgi:hypothetical protein
MALQSLELAVAVPQVVAHRVGRMALAGSSPSARDRQEFSRMIAEKNVAFMQSWQAMGAQALLANQAMAASFLRSLWSLPGQASPVKAMAQWHSAALGIAAKGLTPVHRTAVANAARLGRSKRR